MTQTSALQDRWKALAPREQNLVLAAGSLVALALLWWVAVAPALSTLRAAPARHAALDAQLQRMQSLQAEAQQLQATPATSPGDAVAALRTALTQRLGNTAQLNVAGDRATVTLKGASADALAQWLAQARSNARATPLEARLTRSAAPAATPPPGNAPVTLGSPPVAMPRWDGTVVLALPAAAAR
jgi:general secretion pathway protein M